MKGMSTIKSVSSTTKSSQIRGLYRPTETVGLIPHVEEIAASSNRFLDLSENSLLAFEELYDLLQKERQQRKDLPSEDVDWLGSLERAIALMNRILLGLAQKKATPLYDQLIELLTTYTSTLEPLGVHVQEKGHLSLDLPVARKNEQRLHTLFFTAPKAFFHAFFSIFEGHADKAPYTAEETPHGLFFDRRG